MILELFSTDLFFQVSAATKTKSAAICIKQFFLAWGHLLKAKSCFPGQILFLDILKGLQTLSLIKKCDLCSNQQLHHQEPVSQRTHLLMDWFSVSPHRKHWSQCGARLILEIYMWATGYIKDLLNEGPVTSVQTVGLFRMI